MDLDRLLRDWLVVLHVCNHWISKQAAAGYRGREDHRLMCRVHKFNSSC